MSVAGVVTKAPKVIHHLSFAKAKQSVSRFASSR